MEQEIGLSGIADTGLSESETKDALKALSWPKLKAHLDGILFNTEAFDALLGHMRRHTKLIAKYAAPGFEKRRDAFLDKLEAYLDEKLGVPVRERMAEQRAKMLWIESGYRSILDVLEKCDISKLPPDLRASAYLARANEQYRIISHRITAAVMRGNSLDLASGTLLKDQSGNDYSPDAVVEAVVMTLGATLGMEGYRNGWFDDNDRLIVPGLVPATDKDRYKAGSGEALGVCWRRWERAEEKHRFLDAELRELSVTELPAELPEGISCVIVSKPGPIQLVDFIANERLGDRFVQDYLQLTTQTQIHSQAVGIKGQAELPPKNYISADEAQAVHALISILSFDVLTDQEDRAGLRLVEWVRGYSLLKSLAEDRFLSSHVDPILVEPDELVSELQRVGLSKERSETFLDQVTFSKGSRDLYDCPLLRTQDDRYVLVAPALLATQVAMVTLSNVGRLGEGLSRKGKAFEVAVQKLFRDQSLPCLSFKFKRDGEEYEFDAVVPWGDYIFLFECKNNSLSGYDPVQSYYFGLGSESSFGQVRRLAASLQQHPDVIAEKLGSEFVGKEIIACVLNCLPFSIPTDDDDDVHFTDFSVVRRFFQERYLHTNTLHSLATNKKILHRTAVMSLWKGERPTPEDFLEALKKPVQFDIVQKHTKIHQTTFPISPDTLVWSHEHMRMNTTVSSFSKAVGADPRLVRGDIDGMTEVLRRVKKKHSHVSLRKQDRLWRESKKRRLTSADD